MDNYGCAFVTGKTNSSSYPTTPGTFCETFNGFWDAFVTKFSSNGSSLSYSTFLGEGGLDSAYSLAVNCSGYAYVIGKTKSSQFPTTPDAYDPSGNPYFDVFVTIFNPEGNSLFYSTFLGGDDDDYGSAIDVDNMGNAYVTGTTESTQFPTTKKTYDADHDVKGSSRTFVVKVEVITPGSGDLNEDGNCDSLDFEILAHFLAVSIQQGEGDFTAPLNEADINGDDAVDCVDLTLMMQQ